MAKRVNVNAKDKALVVNRAKGYCEYCKSPADFSTELFSIEHILPISLNGTNEIDNLAFACIGCNIFKSNKIKGFDLITQQNVPLFNPRIMEWDKHFAWSIDFTIILGLSDIGRATIDVLKLNRTQLKNLRRALVAIGVHPQ
jgi:HNH endonuclease